MIYVSTFKKTLRQALKAGGVDKGTAADLTETLSRKYFSEDFALWSPEFKLLEPKVRWKALCRDAATEQAGLPPGLNPAIPIRGVLKWIQHMEYPTTFRTIRRLEALICLAFSLSSRTGPSSTWDEHAADLVDRAARLPTAAQPHSVDLPAIQKAVPRLREIKCLVPDAGWYALRRTIEYQVPDIDD